MEQPLLFLLKTIPEYASLLEGLKEHQSAAVTGVGQINRSHMIAGLSHDLGKPIVVLCQDDMAARRTQEELKCFLGFAPPILPGRDLTFYDAAVVSRSWEQKRLRQLYELAAGHTPIQIMSWESLSQRTIPPAVLEKACFTLELGKEYPLEALTARLVSSGYSRCGNTSFCSFSISFSRVEIRAVFRFFRRFCRESRCCRSFRSPSVPWGCIPGRASRVGMTSIFSKLSVRRWVWGSK